MRLSWGEWVRRRSVRVMMMRRRVRVRSKGERVGGWREWR
jgi:hypothetical protein